MQNASAIPQGRERVWPRTEQINHAYPQRTRLSGGKSEKNTFSQARARGRVDTALTHPYIFLFDPTATPAA